MQIYWNKRKCLHKKRVQLPQDWFGTIHQHGCRFIVLEHQYGCRDVMAAILVSQNNLTAAMLVSQTNPVGVELFSYVNTFFCSSKFAWLLAT